MYMFVYVYRTYKLNNKLQRSNVYYKKKIFFLIVQSARQNTSKSSFPAAPLLCVFVCVLLAKVPLNLTAKKLNIYHTYKLTTNLLQVYHNKLTTGLLQAGGAVFLREGDTTAEVWGYWDRFPCFLRVYCQHPGAGRAVATQKREGDTTAAEGLVVATQGRHDPCVTDEYVWWEEYYHVEW